MDSLAWMAVWSKVPPLTARCLSTTWVRIPVWTCEKVTSDLGLGGGLPGTPVSSTTCNWLVTNSKFQIPKFHAYGNEGVNHDLIDCDNLLNLFLHIDWP